VGVLRPIKIDEQTGHRCYDPSCRSLSISWAN
jgi:hypothetical protein